jgi:hypothetical protein
MEMEKEMEIRSGSHRMMGTTDRMNIADPMNIADRDAYQP